MKDSDRSVLARSPLFTGIPAAEIDAVLDGAGRREVFPEGEVIPAVTAAGRRLGIVLSGAVTVFGTGGVPLNRITAAGLFGAASLFGDGAGAPTRLTAKKRTAILFFTEQEVEALTNDPVIRRNLLSFLCDRIRFLNRKVATFSASDSSEKVKLYLAEHAAEGKVIVDGSLAQLARGLDLGRASLYRALDRLEEQGEIRRDGKTIEILTGRRPEAIQPDEERRK